MGPRVLLLSCSLPWSQRDPPILACNHAIMQSSNQRISLTAHRRGATKPYPLPRRAGQQDSRSLVPMNLVPMFSSDCDGRYVCVRCRSTYVVKEKRRHSQRRRGQSMPAGSSRQSRLPRFQKYRLLLLESNPGPYDLAYDA